MNALETEILFLKQAIVGKKIAAQLPAPVTRTVFKAVILPAPEGNGIRGSDRQVAIVACPLAPDSKLTTRGKVSREGIKKRQIAENEAKIARLKTELGLS